MKCEVVKSLGPNQFEININMDETVEKQDFQTDILVFSH
jgi:hypothetical protein